MLELSVPPVSIVSYSTFEVLFNWNIIHMLVKYIMSICVSSKI